MDPNSLEVQISRQLALLDGLTCGAGEITVRPVLNYGGFVNRSFRVQAPERCYHLKLGTDAYARRGLGRWRALATSLRRDYRAPRMRGWIEIPGGELAGPVFDWIDGSRPDAVRGAVLRDAVETVQRLHGDAPLAGELERLGDPVVSCAAAYMATYHDRSIEDLKSVHAAPPSFVDAGLLSWLDDEVGALADRVATHASFAEAASSPSHRDLWLDNLMVATDGELFILDWDEMALGDPMMDWAMLLGPHRERVRPALHETLSSLPGAAFSPAEQQRFRLYARASLLDWIIDPLADWVEAAHQPEHGAAVRTNNRRVHRQALACYRELYIP